MKPRPHWWLAGPRRVRDVDRLLRHREVPGAHVASATRLFRIGPWMVMAFRYRPGALPVDGAASEVAP